MLKLQFVIVTDLQVESVHEGNKTVEENVTEEADEDSTLQSKLYEILK